MKKFLTHKQEHEKMLKIKFSKKLTSWYGKYIDKMFKKATLTDMTDDWRER